MFASLWALFQLCPDDTKSKCSLDAAHASVWDAWLAAKQVFCLHSPTALPIRDPTLLHTTLAGGHECAGRCTQSLLGEEFAGPAGRGQLPCQPVLFRLGSCPSSEEGGEGSKEDQTKAQCEYKGCPQVQGQCKKICYGCGGPSTAEGVSW